MCTQELSRQKVLITCKVIKKFSISKKKENPGVLHKSGEADFHCIWKEKVTKNKTVLKLVNKVIQNLIYQNIKSYY